MWRLIIKTDTRKNYVFSDASGWLGPLVSWGLFTSVIAFIISCCQGSLQNIDCARNVSYLLLQDKSLKETFVILRIYSSAYLLERLCQSLAVSLFGWNPLFTLILCKDNNWRKVTMQMMDVRRKCSKSVILIMQQTARQRQTRQHQWKRQEKVTLMKMHTELQLFPQAGSLFFYDYWYFLFYFYHIQR